MTLAISSVTSFQDGDFLTPSVLNAKLLNPIYTDLSSIQAGSSLSWFNVKDFGATGDGSTDDHIAIRNTLEAARDQPASNRRGLVYFPHGTYRCNSGISWPAQVDAVGDNINGSIIAFYPSGTGQSLFIVEDAVSGGDGFLHVRDLAFQLASLVTNTSAFNLTGSTPYSVFQNCRFINWTKYGLNFDGGWGSTIQHCRFIGINGKQGSGDIGTAIIAANQTNQFTIRNNEFIVCDRGVQVAESRGVTIDGQNGFETIGYYYVNGVATANPSVATAYGISLNDVKGLACHGNYFEAVKGIGVDANGLRGGSFVGNYFAGEKGSTATVMESAFFLTDYRGVAIMGNSVHESTNSWLRVASGGTVPILGIEQNHVEYGFAVVNPASQASGYNHGGVRSAVTEVSANITATIHDRTIAVNSASTATVTLPLASTCTGQQFDVRRRGTQPVNITATSGSSFNNQSVLSINTQYGGYALQSYGSGYHATYLAP